LVNGVVLALAHVIAEFLRFHVIKVEQVIARHSFCLKLHMQSKCMERAKKMSLLKPKHDKNHV
jgi:hypothetical protein